MVKFWDWSVKADAWKEALEDLQGVEVTRKEKSKIDLRDKVTVFVTTVGAPDFKECLAHLKAQDCRFQLQIIKNVAPMNAAFQKMIDDCKTPFYVQVDEDMLLDPHAVRTLYESITSRSEKMAIWFKALRDRFTGYNLIGVKIYRHEAMVKHPYDPKDFSCEVDQVARLQNDGWVVDGESPGLNGDGTKCIGDLNAFWTPWGAFEKYHRDLQKYRLYPKRQDWMKALPKLFQKKLAENPNDPVVLSAFLGSIIGMLAPLETGEGEKDFRHQRGREPFKALASLLGIDADKAFDVRGGSGE